MRVKGFFLAVGERIGAGWRALTGWMRANLPTLLLSLTPLLMLSGAVASAEWVKDSSAIHSLLIWGWLLGWLLARSRWPGWAAALYGLTIATAIVVVTLGEVLPPLGEILRTPYSPLVEGMRLRLVTFVLRAGGWVQTLQAGGTVRDTGLFLALLALVGWSAAAWMMWWLVRRKQALPGVLPVALLMAVNVHLSRQMIGGFLAFLAVVLLVVARGSYTHVIYTWQRRKVDYSEDLGVEWGVASSLAALSIAALALGFSLIGTPEGLKFLTELVRSSRQQMSDTANQLFGGVRPPPPSQDGEDGTEPLPSINTPNLGEIGTPLPQGNRTIMWVWISDSPPIPPEISGPPRELLAVTRHNWRSQIFAAYDGRGWQPAPLFEGEAPSNEQPTIPPGRYLLEQRYEIEARHSGVLFGVSDPVSVTGDTRMRRVAPDSSRLVEGRASEYTVRSLSTNMTIFDLEQTETFYPEAIREAYLQLPANLPERVRRLAEEVTRGAETPVRKAQRIEEYLRLNLEYRLDAPLPPAGRDVVDYFLFDTQAGFCSHFSSAMVVMLRSVGVPARVVAGYAMGGYDQNRRMYRVPASASHAWVEVFFPGYGWVEFEPTPAYPVFVYPQGGPAPEGLAGNPLPEPTPLPAERRPSQLLWLLVPLGAVALLWGLFWWGRMEKRRLSMPGKAALRLYASVRRGLERAGLPPEVHLTPDEFAARFVPALELYPRVAEALSRSTRVYVQSAYAPREPSIDDVLMGEAAWSEARSELLRLWLNLRFGGKV